LNATSRGEISVSASIPGIEEEKQDKKVLSQ
jgi:hypothetical protein